MKLIVWRRLSQFLLTVLFLAAISLHAQAGIAPVASTSRTNTLSQAVPNKGSSIAVTGATVAGAVITGNGIEYHGGNVIATPNVYFIWYGNWNGDTALTILPQYMSDLSGSSYANINSLYSNNSGNTISNVITFGGQVFDNYSQGAAVAAGGVAAVVTSAVAGGSLPSDANGIYFVLTSLDVTESNGSGSFCTDYCGYHTSTNVNGVDIKYAFVGNAKTQCFNDPNAGATCATHNQTASPNDNPGADAMASVITHELNEAATDPDLNAWYHNDLAGENGDLCNFNYGGTSSQLPTVLTATLLCRVGTTLSSRTG